jgi:maltose O-acetyltransferase
MITGEYYNAGCDLSKDRRRAKEFITPIECDRVPNYQKKLENHSRLITNAGSNLYIEPAFHCDYGYNIVCGDNV